jgi:hypothetical protein
MEVREVELLQSVRVTEKNEDRYLSPHQDGGSSSTGIPEILGTKLVREKYILK